MIYEFEPLTQDEKEMMLKAPALIAVLIAGADNTIEQQELNHAVKLVNIKAFSEKLDLQPYYHEVENTIQQDIEEAIAALPQSSAERNAIINDELAKLNTVLPRLKHKFAHDIYNSWKSFAHSVARSWGGILGINAVSEHEKQWIDLPMINEPMAA
ncbi:hypothetical protein QQ054_17660 [Oscillatoria amoena NRMC-F 0135]|nr:hypothetical protein [Oscillatoria amoena NRMC-F 0135]